MIIVHLLGGLGNQMFQYAAGRAISLHCGTNLKLDTSDFSDYQLHQGFELHRIFNCATEIACKADVSNILGWQSFPRVRRFLSRSSMARLRSKRFVMEPQSYCCHEIKCVPSDSYLMGYWQSEKYFLEVAQQVREDFTFKLPLENHNIELSKQISQVNAVSLHVRRGDYANNPVTTAVHGLCSLEYYYAAIQYIAERVENPFFYIFSDDIEWTKKNLKMVLPYLHVVHNHGIESYNDMRLMSLCQHHIIANSSFSWWGAWLNRNVDKIVVAPQRWYANQTDVKDLLPQGWVRM